MRFPSPPVAAAAPGLEKQWVNGVTGAQPVPSRATDPVIAVPTGRLVVDGKVTPLGADYALRWVDQPEGEARPVLYYRGKRVTRAWSLDLSSQCPADPYGGNANTE